MNSITVIGGGSSAHVLIPLLSKSGLEVNLITSKPYRWNDVVELEYRDKKGEVIDKFRGDLNIITDNPNDVISKSDIIILCMPVNRYRIALNDIGGFIPKDKKVFVGTVYGQGFFNLMVDEMIDEYDLKNVVKFSFGLIPWICRTKVYGKVGILYGVKDFNLIAIEPKSEFESLNDEFLRFISDYWFGRGSFKLSDNFISLSLCTDNQIIHPSRLYDLFEEFGGKWSNFDDVPYFYSDCSENTANILSSLDDDYCKVKDKIKDLYSNMNFDFMLDYLSFNRFFNKSESNKNFLDSLLNSNSLSNIATPVIKDDDFFVIDKNHRFFHDDIFYGLCMVKYLAQKLNLDVYNIDKLLYWAQDLLGNSLIKNDKLVLDDVYNDKFKYGVSLFMRYDNLDDIIK
jgi:hypothetical protein